MHRLRSIFLLGLAAFIPLIVFGGVLGRYLLDQQQQDFTTQVTGKAETIAAALDEELSTHVRLLSILSESPRLDPPVSMDEFGEIARRLQARIPAWSLIRVSDLNGNIIVTTPPRDAKLVADLPSLKRMTSTGEPVVGNLLKGPRGAFGFPVRVPVIRQDRTVLALTAVVRPSAISAVLAKAGVKQGWTAWVTDGSGRVVGSSGINDVTGQAEALFAQRLSGQAADEVIVGGEVLRIRAKAVGARPWHVTVGMPVTAFTLLSQKTIVLLWSTILAAVLSSFFAIYLFQRERAALREQETTVANAQRMDALGKLTGQVAHDFNNLLMIFQAGANAIRRRPDDPARTQQVLSSMLDGVERGRNLTQRLRSFSRSSNKGAEVTDLISALRSVQPLLRQAIDDSVVVEMAVDTRLWPVLIEHKALEIALINLVSNAHDAIDGGGKITVKARNVFDAQLEARRLKGSFVALTVTDTGRGMEPSVLARAPEPLYTTKVTGTGLGLTQVSSFVERSGGGMTISSVSGVGTSVTIYLPRAVSVKTEDPVHFASLPACLLVVDDTPASLEAARLSIEADVREVVTATSGEEALGILRGRSDIDGLLSDVMMPGLSGIELAEIAFRLRPNLRIVLMTGYSDRIENGHTVDFPVVEKPFSFDELHAGFTRAGAGNIFALPARRS